jgi:hypothetical protein
MFEAALPQRVRALSWRSIMSKTHGGVLNAPVGATELEMLRGVGSSLPKAGCCPGESWSFDGQSRVKLRRNCLILMLTGKLASVRGFDAKDLIADSCINLPHAETNSATHDISSRIHPRPIRQTIWEKSQLGLSPRGLRKNQNGQWLRLLPRSRHGGRSSSRCRHQHGGTQVIADIFLGRALGRVA